MTFTGASSYNQEMAVTVNSISSTQMKATIPGKLLCASGTAQINVLNPPSAICLLNCPNLGRRRHEQSAEPEAGDDADVYDNERNAGEHLSGECSTGDDDSRGISRRSARMGGMWLTVRGERHLADFAA